MKEPGIIIIEDEILLAKQYTKVLTDQNMNILGTASNFEEGKQLIETSTPDLALIDINLDNQGLQDDTSGIELGKLINTKYGIPIIYITAYVDDETLEKARKTQFENYLPKPVNNKQLYVSVIEALRKFLTFKINYQNTRIYQNNIIRFESAKNDLLIYTSTQKEPYKTRLKISEIEEELYDFIFLRCHKSHIININYIVRHTAEFVYVKGFKEVKAIPIGPTHKDRVFETLGRR